MNILVTGGAGYIGSHFVKLLSQKTKHQVYILDNLSSGFKESIQNFQLLEVDLSDHHQVSKVFDKFSFDQVYHFAAKTDVNESIKRPLFYYKQNYLNSLHLIECSIKNKVKSFIFSSTAAVYQDPGREKVGEESSIKPLTPYGKSKYMVEQLLLDLSKNYPTINFGVLRYFNVAGSDPELQIGPRFERATHLIKQSLNAIFSNDKIFEVYGSDYNTLDGSGVRDYIHVMDLAQAHLDVQNYLTETDSINFDIFNCGYGKGYSVLEIINTLQKVSGVSLNIRFKERRAGDLGEVVCCNNKLLKKTKFVPIYNNIDFILETAYKWEQKLRTP